MHYRLDSDYNTRCMPSHENQYAVGRSIRRTYFRRDRIIDWCASTISWHQNRSRSAVARRQVTSSISNPGIVPSLSRSWARAGLLSAISSGLNRPTLRTGCSFRNSSNRSSACPYVVRWCFASPRANIAIVFPVSASGRPVRSSRPRTSDPLSLF
jgi:hypothetical protein